MPYAVPSAETATVPRPARRHTRTSFSDEAGPGAFVSLGALPRRRSSKGIFHLNPDDSENESPARAFRLPPSHIDLPPITTHVPFPRSSPQSPSPSQRNSPFVHPSPPHTSSLPRSPSTPTIILSNGKPLKSSLKSSLSTPDIPDFRIKHLRAQSAPSTPNPNKNVHFAESDSGLVSIRLFNRSGKPASVSKRPDGGNDTETETEQENSNNNNNVGYPFPIFPAPTFPGTFSQSQPSSSSSLSHEIDLTPSATYPIPNPNASHHANVHLETVTLPRTRPSTLRGTVLVRNLAFEKHVAVRFTLDEWQTTSEVACKHVVSLPGLPPPFPQARFVSVGDIAGHIASGRADPDNDQGNPLWDRFSFTIRLEDYEHKLTDRTLWLVARYNTPTGEWWDNNSERNYRVGFKRAPTSTPSSPLLSPSLTTATLAPLPPKVTSTNVTAQAHQGSFKAPSSLRYTPMTGSLAPPSAPAMARSVSSPYPFAPAQLQFSIAPTTATATATVSASASAARSAHARLEAEREKEKEKQTALASGKYIARRLSLSNYVAPGSDKHSAAVLTPPTTPPIGASTLPPSSSPPSLSLPAKREEPAVVTVLPGNDEDCAEGAQEGYGEWQLCSPPPSREVSEDGSGEGGRGTPASPSSLSRASSSSRVDALATPTPASILGLSAGASAGMSDSKYAAFVREWCFAQSADGGASADASGKARGAAAAASASAIPSASPRAATPVSVSAPVPIPGPPRRQQAWGVATGESGMGSLGLGSGFGSLGGESARGSGECLLVVTSGSGRVECGWEIQKEREREVLWAMGERGMVLAGFA